MRHGIDFPQGLELHDPASGANLGVFVPKDAYGRMTAELEALRKQIAEQQAKLAEVEAERDAYRQTVDELWPKGFPRFTKEELEDARKNGIPFREVLDEIDRMASNPRTDGGRA
jgi:hypothetical protein